MENIYIPHLLKAKERQKKITLDENIAGLETLTPVRGEMTIRHGGSFLEISARVETIVTLVCDRCLKQYNKRLSIKPNELIWLEKEEIELEDLPLEREIKIEDLSENLPPDGHFDPNNWLYEQLSLAMPLRKVCGKDCQGVPEINTDEPTSPDKRWSNLEVLKKMLNSEI